jgi:molecular chaperone DnaK (HSP70)
LKAKNVEGITCDTKNGYITFSSYATHKLYESSIRKIQKNILDKCNLRDITYIVLVGGFGSSFILQNNIKEYINAHAPNSVLFVPAEPELAVVTGAVSFGFNKTLISSRLMRKTYGVLRNERHNPDVHRLNRKIEIQKGRSITEGIFQVVVKKYENIMIGRTEKLRLAASYEGQKEMEIEICTTDDTSGKILYDDSPELKKEGEIKIQLTGQWVTIQFYFGGTEIRVTAIDESSGREAHVVLDFLLN